MKTYVLCILLCLTTCNVFAWQTRKLDSLLKVLETNIIHEQKVKVYVKIARRYNALSDSLNTALYIQKAIALAQKTNYPKGEADAYHRQAWMLRRKGYYTAANTLFKQALKISKKASYDNGIANAYNGLGAVHDDQAHYEEALKYYQKTLAIDRKMGNKRGLSSDYNNIGIVYQKQGKYRLALKYYQKSMQLDKVLGDKSGMAYGYNNIGIVYSKLGNYPLTLEYYRKSLAIKQALGNTQGVANSYHNMGAVYRKQGNYPKALEHYKKSLKINEKTGSKKNVANNYTNIGSVFHALNNDSLALAYVTRALRVYKQLQNRQGIANNYKMIGNIHQTAGRFQQAEVYYQKFLAMEKEIGNKESLADGYLNLGMLAIETKQYVQAQNYLEIALTMHKAQGRKDPVSETQVALAEVFFLQKNYPKAIHYATQGVAKAEEVGNPATIRDGAAILAKSHHLQGQPAKAYQYQVIFKQMSDSLINVENTRKITRMEVELEFRQAKDSMQKANTLQRAQLEKEQLTNRFQRNINWLVLTVLTIVLVFMFFVYRSRQQQKRLNVQLQQQKQGLKAQSEELTTLNEELLQNKEEIAAQRDILAFRNTELLHHQYRINKSFKAAQVIQHTLLPSDQLLRRLFSDYFVLYQPKDVVSGDFYWIAEVGKRWVMVVADCTGHGVPGAFMTLIGSKLLDSIVKINQVVQPAEILTQLNESVLHTMKRNTGQQQEIDMIAGMDAVVLSVSSKDNHFEIDFAGAKNDLLYFDPLTRTFGELKGSRMSVGGFQTKRKVFTQQHISLPAHSILYAGSDGFQDQNNEQRKRFGYDALKQLLEQNVAYPLTQQKNLLEEALKTHMQYSEQRDDILWLGLKL
ncbi:tetratricopeptide repeat protein [Microscilla marina]|uniref:Tetratricopeptide repeat domain protein n=1 Tax=Microscilla marina ATCC 23134 TaxID=313606 RepID=A1ZRS9_MICM2|nr:tetratricopeptide repeat protein [Microscilla marina]EAY26984.1 tetratricopeptide repeat domain protein [Microscilla marina ATCC 23134]